MKIQNLQRALLTNFETDIVRLQSALIKVSTKHTQSYGSLKTDEDLQLDQYLESINNRIDECKRMIQKEIDYMRKTVINVIEMRSDG